MAAVARSTVLAGLLVAGAAHAVQVQERDLPCPTGSGTIRVYDRLSADRLGGYDSDLADYSSHGQWRTYAVSTCTVDLYSAYAADATTPIPEGRRAAVDRALASARAALVDPANPTVWERYALAEAVYAALGRDPATLAQLELEGSWTVRDAAVGYFPALNGPEVERAYLDAGQKELAKSLALEDRKKLLYNLARIAERGGWPAERDAYLAELERVGAEAGGLSAEEVAAVARFRLLAGTVEPAFQDRAIANYTRALADKGFSGAARARAEYTLAELLRRRGRAGEAAPHFAAVVAAPDAPEELKTLARQLSP